MVYPMERASGSICNGYDLAFLTWFNRERARIWCYIGSPEVVTYDESACPFKVTRGMVKRLDEARLIQKIFPRDAGIWDEWYAPNDL